MSLDVLVLNVAFQRSACVRAFVDSIWVELLFDPPYLACFNPIERVFRILIRNDRSTGRSIEALNTR